MAGSCARHEVCHVMSCDAACPTLSSHQGHVEAYGSYSELLAKGVELMQLMKSKDQEDERDLFSFNEEEEDEYEEEEEEEGQEERGEERTEGGGERDTAHLVPLNDLHSPYVQRRIIYYDDSHPDLSTYLRETARVHYAKKDFMQVPPNPDSTSIYSAPSMLSLHSAVEAESSKHEEQKAWTCTSIELLLLATMLTASNIFSLVPRHTFHYAVFG